MYKVKVCTKFSNSEVLDLGLFFKTVLSALLTTSFIGRKHNTEVDAVPIQSGVHFTFTCLNFLWEVTNNR